MTYHLSGPEYTEWEAFYQYAGRKAREAEQQAAGQPIGRTRSYSRGRRHT